jgi:hypothetical protein
MYFADEREESADNPMTTKATTIRFNEQNTALTRDEAAEFLRIPSIR